MCADGLFEPHPEGIVAIRPTAKTSNIDRFLFSMKHLRRIDCSETYPCTPKQVVKRVRRQFSWQTSFGPPERQKIYATKNEPRVCASKVRDGERKPTSLVPHYANCCSHRSRRSFQIGNRTAYALHRFSFFLGGHPRFCQVRPRSPYNLAL